MAIETLLLEQRRFPPPPNFAAQANVNDPAIYERAATDLKASGPSEAAKLDWFEPWDTVLEWDPPFAKWFIGGQLNVSSTASTATSSRRRRQGRVLLGGGAGRPADNHLRRLYDEVSRCANALKELGVRRGDRVAIYMPMIPELPIAMLACARIGAPHTVVFGGFSAEALRRPDQRRRRRSWSSPPTAATAAASLPA